jgi:hypothetical protein
MASEKRHGLHGELLGEHPDLISFRALGPEQIQEAMDYIGNTGDLLSETVPSYFGI